MSIRRWISADHRAARSAEAAGNLDAAAKHYALAGDPESAVRLHLARAARAADRIGEVAALRDALHWAGDDPALNRVASAALGRVLLASTLAEGIATQRDHANVRAAAALLTVGGEYREAGKAYEQVDDLAAAAHAYSIGGHVELMEAAMAKDEARTSTERAAHGAFADYQVHQRLGRRDDARAALEAAIAHAPSREHRRLLDDLVARLLTAAKVELRPRSGSPVIVSAAETIGLGRDGLCDLPLRAGGVSRRHAEIDVGGQPRFAVRDTGSRNGTLLGGMPISGTMPLAERGVLELGDECRIEYRVAGEPAILTLTVENGIDRGRALVVGCQGDRIDLTEHGLACDLVFSNRRPFLGRASGSFQLGTGLIACGRVQLISGDVITIDGTEIDIA